MWSAVWLLSRREWVNVREPKHEATLWIEEKRLWCRQGLLWGLFIQLMTLAESDSIIMCLWCRRQLEADNSIALTTAFSSATLESKIPTDKEKIPRIIPLWFRKTPSTFKIVHGYSPFPPYICTSASAESFAQHIHDLCAVIRWKIALSIENYKLSFDTHCRNK